MNTLRDDGEFTITTATAPARFAFRTFSAKLHPPLCTTAMAPFRGGVFAYEVDDADDDDADDDDDDDDDEDDEKDEDEAAEAGYDFDEGACTALVHKWGGFAGINGPVT